MASDAELTTATTTKGERADKLKSGSQKSRRSFSFWSALMVVIRCTRRINDPIFHTFSPFVFHSSGADLFIYEFMKPDYLAMVYSLMLDSKGAGVRGAELKPGWLPSWNRHILWHHEETSPGMIYLWTLMRQRVESKLFNTGLLTQSVSGSNVPFYEPIQMYLSL